MARTDKSRSPALAYLRTSSAANVGTDKDSEKRRRHAIQGFANRAGFGIVEELYDAAVSGADPIETREHRCASGDGISSPPPLDFIIRSYSSPARILQCAASAIKTFQISPDASYAAVGVPRHWARS